VTRKWASPAPLVAVRTTLTGRPVAFRNGSASPRGGSSDPRANPALTRRTDIRARTGHRITRTTTMSQIVYIVGAIVIVIAVLSFVGLA
jgi:hypothetical protein